MAFCYSRNYLRSLRSNIVWFKKPTAHSKIDLIWKALLVSSHQPPPKPPPTTTKHFQHIVKFSSIDRNSVNFSVLAQAMKGRSRFTQGMRRADWIRMGWAGLDVQSVIQMSYIACLGNFPYLLDPALNLCLCDWLQSISRHFICSQMSLADFNVFVTIILFLSG